MTEGRQTMEVIQFSDAVSKMAKSKQMPKITTEQKEQWLNNASFRFYNAVREVNKNLKRKYRIDQVGSLIRDSIFIAVDIITDKDFETMAKRATAGGSVGHYVPLDAQRITDILKIAL